MAKGINPFKDPEFEDFREIVTLSLHFSENKTTVRMKALMAPTSKQEIKADVRKILNQFLKKQQLNDNEGEGAIPTGFQRAGVEKVIETYGSGSTNTSWEEYEYPQCYAECPGEVSQSIPAGSNRSPTDDTTNFTFIDEDEHDVGRSDKDHSKRYNSPPLSDEIPVCRAGWPQRLKSGTESETNDTDYDEIIFPNEDVEKTAEGTARPAVGRQGLTFGTKSDTDEIYHEEEFISLTEKVERILGGTAMGLKSGLECEKELYDLYCLMEQETIMFGCSSNYYFIYEVFKHTFVQLTRFLLNIAVGAAKLAMGRQRLMSGTESDTDDTDYDEDSVIIKRSGKSRKKKDIDSSVDIRRVFIQNLLTHIYGHVEHHYTNGNKSEMLMESEVWEGKDMAGKSEHKHEERHSNIRESKEQTSDDENEFIGRLRKMIFFKKTMRPRHAALGRTNSEKDRLYTAVAEKFAHIGDHYKATSPLSDSTRSSVDHTTTRRVSARTPNLPGVDERGSDGLTALERELRDAFREVGDTISLKLYPDFLKDAVMEIIKQAMYQKFQEVVDKKIGPGNSWDQIAAVFYLTKKIVILAGVSRVVAQQVKDLAAEYVADKFATWIVDQGGWDTFLDSDSDLDID